MRYIKLIGPAAVAALAIAGCGKKSQEQLPPLAYVPADTPYVMANTAPLPKEVSEPLMQKFKPAFDLLEKHFDALSKDGAAATPATAEGKVAFAVIEALKGKFSPQGLEGIGFSLQSQVAMYGIGLIPVLRLELKNPKAFTDFVAGIEQKAGQKLPTAQLGDLTYWRLEAGDKKLNGIVAVHGSHLIVSIIPNTPSETLLRALLGFDPPEASVLKSGRLEALNKQYGFTPYGSGYVDFVSLAARLLDAKTPLEKEYMAAWGTADKPASEICKKEALGLVQKMPRAVFGYPRFDLKRMDQKFIVETEPELRKTMQRFATRVPGLGASGQSLINLGLGLEVSEVQRFIAERARDLQNRPYQCEQLAKLNSAAAQMNEQMANPMVMGASNLVKGFHVMFSQFELPAEILSEQFPNIKAKVILVSDNAMTLVNMAKTMVQPLANVDLKPNAPPIPLDLKAYMPQQPPVFVAMTPKAIGLSIGAGEEADLPVALQGAAGSPPAIFLFGYEASIYKEIAKIMDKINPTEDKNAGAFGSLANAYNKSMLEMQSGLIKREDQALLFTDQGIEFVKTTEYH